MTEYDELFEATPVHLLEIIDEVCREFEDAWKADPSARIEPFVNEIPAEAARLGLIELIRREMELRQTVGEAPDKSDYQRRFSADETAVRLAVHQQRLPGRDSLAEQAGAEGETNGLHETTAMRQDDAAADMPAALGSLAALIPSRYQLIRRIGRGGMGSVFLARHKSLGANVAIKLVHYGGSNARFLNEARVLARIKSPHVVRVNDYEILENGTPILIMEWIDGENLASIIGNTGAPLDQKQAWHWMRQVCDGMCAAEEQGIIHRDLKPSNIIIDRAGTAHVADFGLAHNPHSAGDLSASQGIMGTVHYMAPEQAENPRSVDARADIYSFGATFYHIFTNAPPFDGESWFSVLLQHKTEPLIPPKTRNPTVGEWVSDLLERCLSKSPSGRFQSFRDLKAVLAERDLQDNASSPWDQLNVDEDIPHIDRYRSRRTAYLQQPPDDDLADDYQFPNGRVIRIVSGDIADQQVDAIVNSAASHLGMHKGLPALISNAAGPEVGQVVRSLVPAQAGRAVVTPAGDLKAKYIFHAVTTGQRSGRPTLASRDVISEAIKSCLYHAETHLVRSIAFPLLGSGTREGKFSNAVCLDTMFKHLSRTMANGLTTVREARIVLPTADAIIKTATVSDKVLRATIAEITEDTLAQITEILRPDRDIDDALTEVLEALLAAFGKAGRATIYTVEGNGAAPHWSVVRHKLANTSVPIADSVAAETMRSGKANLTDASYASVDADSTSSNGLSSEQIPRSIMSVPLLDHHGACLGVVQLESHNPHLPFRSRELETLTTVAAQIQSAIENAVMRGQLLESKAIQRDLQVATEVQKAFLPGAPEVPEFEFFDFYEPAQWVGGDIIDYVRLSETLCLGSNYWGRRRTQHWRRHASCKNRQRPAAFVEDVLIPIRSRPATQPKHLRYELGAFRNPGSHYHRLNVRRPSTPQYFRSRWRCEDDWHSDLRRRESIHRKRYR